MSPFIAVADQHVDQLKGWARVDDGPSPARLAGFYGQIISIKFDPAVHVDMALHGLDDGIESLVNCFGIAEEHMGCRGEDATDPLSPGVGMPSSCNEHGATGGQTLSDYPFDGRHDHIVCPEHMVPPEVVDDNCSAHKSSSSVGPPPGTVCDNSNPTDGGHGGGSASNPHGAAPDPR